MGAGALPVKIAKAPEAGPSRPVKPADRFANYSTAASLGYTDVDAEILSAQKDLHAREGVVGEWTVVAPPIPVASSTSTPPSSRLEDDTEEARTWKLDFQQKKAGVGLGEVYDPGVIKVKRKEGETVKKEELEDTPAATPMPVWTPRTWKSSNAPETSEDTKPDIKSEPPDVKIKEEDDTPSIQVEELTAESEVKAEPDAPEPSESSSSGLFRKRKAPSGNASSRGVRRKV